MSPRWSQVTFLGSIVSEGLGHPARTPSPGQPDARGVNLVAWMTMAVSPLSGRRGRPEAGERILLPGFAKPW